jgi:hypothetical protein
MTAAATRASELQRYFNNLEATAGSGWEGLLLSNAYRVSMPLATRMLSQMGLGNETKAPFRLLENACGVGVVAPILQKVIKPDALRQSSIVCGDFSEEVVGLAKKRVVYEAWVNTEATKVDAQVRSPILFFLGRLAHKMTDRMIEHWLRRRRVHTCRHKHRFSCRARL